MVERQKINEKLLLEVREIYDWLDLQIAEKLSGKCDTCGKCCDFAAYDHRLYVTIPEISYLTENLNGDSLKPMPTGRCPYNMEGKCTVYQYRFSGCRIFNCKANPDIQSELSESVLKKLKALCEKYNIPYRYMDLALALNKHTDTKQT
ncbi:MAG: YkgJ family cysteine cluster protein [Sedimentisphaerales bacterium]|nr:YkgJ family cysteine cluster protein [Sedimentisphaerales bacterium]